VSGREELVPDFFGMSGGPIIVAGFDSEDHDEQTIKDHLNFCISNSFVKSTKGEGTQVLMLGGNATSMGGLDLDQPVNMTTLSSSLGYSLTHKTGSEISSVDFFDYDMVHLPTDEAHVANGLNQNDYDKIAVRSEDFSVYLASGGGISAFAQQFDNKWEWFPYGPSPDYPHLTTLNGLDFGTGGSEVELEILPAAVNIYDPVVIANKPFHSIFAFPSGLFNLIPFVIHKEDIGGYSDEILILEIDPIPPGGFSAREGMIGGETSAASLLLPDERPPYTGIEDVLTYLHWENTEFDPPIVSGSLLDVSKLTLGLFDHAISGDMYFKIRRIEGSVLPLDTFMEEIELLHHYLEDSPIISFGLLSTELTTDWIHYQKGFTAIGAGGANEIPASINTMEGWDHMQVRAEINIFNETTFDEIDICQWYVAIEAWSGVSFPGGVNAMGHPHAGFSGLISYSQ